MLKKILLVSLIFILWSNPSFTKAATLSPLKIGDEAPSFVLPSSQGSLVDYYKDYYGKYHLIITFFPAAFTTI